MKKTAALLLLFLLPVFFASLALSEYAGEASAEWTVMFYLCGSDLESSYSYASNNLEEISGVIYPDNLLPAIAQAYGVEVPKPAALGEVNILIETGGAKEWHARHLGMEIRSDALQRWQYCYYPEGGSESEDLHDGFEIMETLPLQSMAAPETLTDFIRWGAATCPAKKYALVLWGHGCGAGKGLFVDELFDNDLLYLYELRQALSTAGVMLEAVVLDACLMANLETAWSIGNSARWMIASEEIVPGMGTNIGEWLKQLVCNPGCDGKWLGRSVCDTSLVKYMNFSEEQYKSILTWSVIDLDRIESLITAFGNFFEAMNDALRYYPQAANLYARSLFEASELGDGQEDMRDLASVVSDTTLVYSMVPALRNDLLNALTDAVVYNVRGPGRSESLGLSFCYPTDFSAAEMDVYAQNFPMPVYLAFLDAITAWEAPAWVFERAESVPDIDTIEEFRIKAVKRLSQSGMPALDLSDSLGNIDNVYYRLYRVDPETGDLLRLGRTDCGVESWGESFRILFRATDPLHWPSVDGQLFCMDLIQTRYSQKLYNVPVQINSQNGFLRCGRTVMYSDDGSKRWSDYEIFGLWLGYEEDIDLMNRSVQPLSALAGQQYRFLYPVDGQGGAGKTNYRLGSVMPMYRALLVEEIPLPPGTYFLEYEVDDMFNRPYLLDRIEYHWDGENMTFPEDFSWEGEIILRSH